MLLLLSPGACVARGGVGARLGSGVGVVALVDVADHSAHDDTGEGGAGLVLRNVMTFGIIRLTIEWGFEGGEKKWRVVASLGSK